MKKVHTDGILINQIGYPSQARKIGLFTENNGPFMVIDSERGEVVFEGQLSKPQYSAAAQKTFYHGDFTQITTPGTYKLMQANQESVVFTIAEHLYESLHKGLLKSFYYLRCGSELPEEFAGQWPHQACHLESAIVYGDEERKIDVSGGWHDAGDYGKYVVAAAKAVTDLLLAYELYENAFVEPISLPETDGVMPDVLHECLYELEWLLKMQDSQTGGVYHKVTTLNFPGLNVMPEADLADLYVSPISATATATFAAVTAQAARIYKLYKPDFSEHLLNRAEQAWDWIEKNPDAPGFNNPAEITTGEYGDEHDIDEQYWAAAELYRTTKKQSYHQAFQALAKQDFPKYELSWADVGGYGTMAYLLTGKADAEPELYEQLYTGLITSAETFVTRTEQEGLGISLSPDEFNWGSNMLVMNRAMHLLFAYHFQANQQFEAAALSHLDYLLGKNSLDISYVTGFGERSVQHIHHRPSVADDVIEPVPGYVSGGPNKNLDDEISKKRLQGKAPAESFIDHIGSYATNEITIYWNSPTVFVVSHWMNSQGGK